MTKKVFSKAVAVMLAAAMCMVAVFAGTVGAANPKSADCTVTGYGYYEGAKDSYVVAKVEFTSDDPFTAGSFTVSAPGLTFNDCSVAQDQEGDAPQIYLNVSNGKVIFAGFDDTTSGFDEYTDLKLLLKFTVDKPLFNYAAGETWSVTVSNIDITNTDEEVYNTNNATNSAISSPDIHIHSFGEGETENGITTSKCTVCEEEKTSIENTSALGPNNLVQDGQNHANVTFTADGDVVLNALLSTSGLDDESTVYFIYHWTEDVDGVSVEKTATSVSAGTIQDGAYYSFPCGRNGGVGRLDRNVTGNFVVVNGTEVTMSKTWSYSIKTYAETIINNNEYETIDKNYAKALLNYGYYTAEILELSNDVEAYENVPYTFDNAYNLPESKNAIASGTDENWNLAGVSVTTGFKPKMNMRFNADTISNMGTVTIKVVYDEKEVYFKEVAIDMLENNTYVLADVPTKYLTGDIVIGAKDSVGNPSAKTITYSYGRYAKARVGKTDENVFKALMNWSYYLGLAF